MSLSRRSVAALAALAAAPATALAQAPEPPDVVLEFARCLTPIEAVGVQAALPPRLPALGPIGPDYDVAVQSACVAGAGRVGVWVTPHVEGQAPVTAPTPGRDLGLQQAIVPRRANEPGLMLVSSGLIARLADDALPDVRRVKVEGRTLRLHRLDVRLEAPDRVVTTLDGEWVIRYLPDPDFTVISTDRLRIRSGLVACSTRHRLEAPARWLLKVANFFTGRAGAGEEGAPLPLGCGLARAVFTSGPMLPGGLAIPFRYTRVEVSPAGIAAAFTVGPAPVPRRPAVEITGPTRAWAGAPRTYRVTTRDLRGDLRVTWSATGGSAAPAEGPVTTVRFTGAGLLPGEPGTGTVRVRVTDADGLTAEAARRVEVTGR